MRSPIKWVGGKSRLAKRIVEQIPPHQCYVEVFGGAAWTLFAKQARSKIEVLNDRDGELINFFRVVQERPRELIRSFGWTLASRGEFERLVALEPTTLDEVQRAHRFYYIIMSSWGGELYMPRFQISMSDDGHGNRLIGALKSVRSRLMDAHGRLQTVIIESLDWRECLARYDRPHTFFYLDPPYPGNNCNYMYNMRAFEEHEALFEQLGTLKGQWLLSTYDKPELKALYNGYHILPVDFPSGMNGYRNREILVANYELPRKQD